MVVKPDGQESIPVAKLPEKGNKLPAQLLYVVSTLNSNRYALNTSPIRS